MPRRHRRPLFWACLLGLAWGGCARGSVTEKLDAGLGEPGEHGDAALGHDLDPGSAGADGTADSGAGPGGKSGSGGDGSSQPGGGGDGSPVGGGSSDAGSSSGGGTTDKPRCVPGTYVGTFSGTISAFFIVNIPISGELTIEGLSSDTGDVLTINNGKIDGTDQDGNPVTANVVGTMNCTTYKLEGGALKNGVYVRKSINQTVNFEGTVEATYLPTDPPTVMGSWHTKSDVESGSGPFSASLMK